jgi:hypothetical protein
MEIYIIIASEGNGWHNMYYTRDKELYEEWGDGSLTNPESVVSLNNDTLTIDQFIPPELTEITRENYKRYL